HVLLRRFDGCETKLCVKAVCIACKKIPAPQLLQTGVCHDALHHPLAQAVTTIRFQYKHITETSISRIIRNHTSKTRSFISRVHAEAQSVLKTNDRRPPAECPLPRSTP